MTERPPPPDYSPLLALWRRCPECAPEGVYLDRNGVWFTDRTRTMRQSWGDAIACDAMERWLSGAGIIFTTTTRPGSVRLAWVTVEDSVTSETPRLIKSPTKRDALVAACNAVLDAREEKP